MFIVISRRPYYSSHTSLNHVVIEDSKTSNRGDATWLLEFALSRSNRPCIKKSTFSSPYIFTLVASPLVCRFNRHLLMFEGYEFFELSLISPRSIALVCFCLFILRYCRFMQFLGLVFLVSHFWGAMKEEDHYSNWKALWKSEDGKDVLQIHPVRDSQGSAKRFLHSPPLLRFLRKVMHVPLFNQRFSSEILVRQLLHTCVLYYR